MRILILLLVLIFSGCATSSYDWETEVTYIPPLERPIRFYRWNDFWYAEPYAIFIFEDSSGYRTRRKVPTSKLNNHMRRNSSFMKNKNDIDSVMKDVNKMKQYQDRMKNKRRIRNRK